MVYLHITIICIISSTQIQCDSTLHRTMFGTELKITKYIERHVEQLEKNVNRVERRIDKLLSKWNRMDKADCVSTPLTAMAMVLRLEREWLPLTTMVGRFTKLSHLPLGKVRWPSIADIEGAARGVMRSQITYDLSTQLLARGVQNDMFLTNVTVADYFEIGRQYFLKERFSEAKEWLQHALAGVHDSDLSTSRQTVLYYLATALCFSGDAISSVNIIRNILKENPLSKPPNDLSDYFIIMGSLGCVYPEERIYQILDRRHVMSDNDLVSISFYRNNTAIELHSRLCRGEVQPDSRLVCLYAHYQQPHLRLQPFKLEELQLDPPVLRFYDLVSDKEAESLINRAKPTLLRANVGLSRRATDYRTSHVKWLNEKNTSWLTRRISEATRLDANLAELHQVSRYSVTGEYLPHVDFFDEKINWTKDRFATVMFYLNDVEQGGNTIFTKWKLSVPPVRNSAVMWFNYKPSGKTDYNSQHSGCPVLKGSKWVLNKWIYNSINHVNFPCTLNKQGSFKGFYL